MGRKVKTLYFWLRTMLAVKRFWYLSAEGSKGCSLAVTLLLKEGRTYLRARRVYSVTCPCLYPYWMC